MTILTNWSYPIYGTTMAGAFLFCGLLFLYHFPRRLLTLSDALNFCLIVILVTLVGSKFFSWISFTVIKTGHPIGHSSLPALVSTLLLIWGYCWVRSLPFTQILDILIPYGLLALAIQRGFGCYNAGCCHGSPTDLFWGVMPPPDSPAAKLYLGHKVHPTQILYASSALIGALLTWRISYIYAHKNSGLASAFGIAWFALFKLLIGPLRGDVARSNYWWLPIDLWPALGLLLLAIFFMIHRLYHPIPYNYEQTKMN
ncbi:hypothetical protein TI03_00260 [Achromatium sp. WMS1]|nr:hypothetical protein TI03_00260 [Achromatium sp. WMS1]